MYASRLLTMKRPDFFFCMTARNRDRFLDSYPISSRKHDYDWYWTELLPMIHESLWWKCNKPTNRDDAEIWNGRAALLDAGYYLPPLE